MLPLRHRRNQKEDAVKSGGRRWTAEGERFSAFILQRPSFHGRERSRLKQLENQEYRRLDLQGESLEDSRFVECRFSHCRFQNLELSHCSFYDCTFEDCTALGVSFRYTDAKNNRFVRCSLLGVNWTELQKSGNAFLPFLSFEACTLKHNVFFHQRLKRMDFSFCDLGGSFFDECDLTESRFTGANLKGTLFSNNNLTGADFREAKDYAISLENNKLKKARFSFPDALNLLTALGIVIN